MAITPWTQGNLAPSWVISLVPDSGSVTVSGLVTTNFSLRIRNNNLATETTGAGFFSNITAAVVSGGVVTTPASVQYQLAAADVSTIGNFTLWVDVTFSNGVESFALGFWQVVAE